MLAVPINNRLIAAGALVLLMAAGVAHRVRSGEENDQKGVVTYVEGTAKKQALEEADWRSVSRNTPVASGERVRTYSESRAELEILRIDRIRMAPRTTIDILKLYEESVEQVRESKIHLQSGDLWAQVGKKDEQLRFSITTPVAAAAITGTTLRLSVAADSSAELKVYTGEVVLNKEADVRPPAKRGMLAPQQVPGPTPVAGPHEVSLEQWSMIVKSMQKVRVNNRGQVIQSGSFSAQDPEEQNDWVRWNQRRDQGQE